jgi:hypothetical protein
MNTSEWVFRPSGGGRYFSGAFLLLWLCGWLVGEVLALTLLFHGLYCLLTGQPPLRGNQPLNPGMILVTGFFLLVWLTIWTVGGLAALRELFRLFGSEDRLQLDLAGLTRRRRLGPFRRATHWPRSDIRRVFVQPSGARREVLMLQAGPNVVELTDLGTAAERAAAAKQIRAALRLPAEDAPSGLAALPEDWEEITDSRGARLLVPNQKTRRQQARGLTAATAVAWLIVLALAWGTHRHDPNLLVVTLMLGVLAAWLTRQSLWLYRGRKEWRLERGKLVHQRRAGAAVTELFEARGLALEEETDSDGDRWYELRAIQLSPPAVLRHDRPVKVPDHVRLKRVLHDAAAVRALGHWLAQRTGVVFQDRVPDAAARAADLEQLRAKLANSGKLGALFARWLSRLEKHHRPTTRPPQ